jgi:hypothetical protein
VKRYRNKELEVISDKIFQNIAVITAELKRNPQLRAFKYDGDVYIAPKDCFKSKNEDVFAEMDDFAVGDNARKEKSYDEVVREERRSKPTVTKSYSGFDRNKYYIELGAGIASINSKEQVLPDYTLADTSDGTTTVTFKKDATESPYKTKTLINLGFGSKFSENSFLAFKIKKINGSKIDVVSATINGTPNNPQEFTYTDTFTNAYVGGKFFLSTNSSWKPSVSLFLGVSILDGKLSLNNVEILKYSATDLAGVIEGGLEYLISSQFTIGGNFGYEYLGQKKLKAKDQTGNLSKDSIKTKINYSNMYGITGLNFYF